MKYSLAVITLLLVFLSCNLEDNLKMADLILI